MVIRSAPKMDGSKTFEVIKPSVVFGVSEEKLGDDGVLFLKLSDGRGWVFDDAALYPEDPSVVLMSPYELASPCALPERVTPLAPAIAKRRAFERNPMAKKVLDRPELVGAEDTLVSLANGLSSA